jgi:hypothetical protein
MLNVCEVKNIKKMEKVQKVHCSDVSSAPLPRDFMFQIYK